jgi:hypothetical protein
MSGPLLFGQFSTCGMGKITPPGIERKAVQLSFYPQSKESQEIPRVICNFKKFQRLPAGVLHGNAFGRCDSSVRANFEAQLEDQHYNAARR